MYTRAVSGPNKRAVVPECFCSFLGLHFCTKVGIHSWLRCSFIFHTDNVVSVIGSSASKIYNGFLKCNWRRSAFSLRGMKSCISDDVNFLRTVLFTQVCLAIEHCCSCVSHSRSRLKQWKSLSWQVSNGNHFMGTPMTGVQELSVQPLQLVECICCHRCSGVQNRKLGWVRY